VREWLPLRPVVPIVVPIVVRTTVQPWSGNGRVDPGGVVLGPCASRVHQRAELDPDPGRFRPIALGCANSGRTSASCSVVVTGLVSGCPRAVRDEGAGREAADPSATVSPGGFLFQGAAIRDRPGSGRQRLMHLVLHETWKDAGGLPQAAAGTVTDAAAGM